MPVIRPKLLAAITWCRAMPAGSAKIVNLPQNMRRYDRTRLFQMESANVLSGLILAHELGGDVNGRDRPSLGTCTVSASNADLT